MKPETIIPIAILLIIGIIVISPNLNLGTFVPGISSVTIECDSGATCKQIGENWNIIMNAQSNAQTINLVLPQGTTQINGDLIVKTQGKVTIEVDEKAPTQSVPVIEQDFEYSTGFYDAIGLTKPYKTITYERSGFSSIITTHYNIQLLTANGNSQIKSMDYDYRQPKVIELSDNSGNVATITPNHQTYGGFLSDSASVIFVDNGEGGLTAYDKSSFIRYSEMVNNDIIKSSPLWNSIPDTWPEYLELMKSKGLHEFNDVPFIRNKNEIIFTYPVGSIGTQLQAIIPKKMANSITVTQHTPKPVIDSITLTPEKINLGEGSAKLIVKITNKGTTDTINVNAIVNGATVTAIVNSLKIPNNEQGIFEFNINPTISVASNSISSVDIKIIVTATNFREDTIKTLLVGGKVKTGGDEDKINNEKPSSTIKNIKWYETTGAILLILSVIALMIVAYMRREEQ